MNDGDRLVDQRTQHLWVHSSIDDMTDLSPNAMRVYMHLVRRADKTGVAWPSYQKIGDHCFSSVSDNEHTRKTFARNAIDELIAANLIRKEERVRDDGGQSSNAYVLVDPLLSSTPMPISTPHAYEGTPRAYQAPEGNPIEGTPIKKPDTVANATALATLAPPILPITLVYRNFLDELKSTKNRTDVLRRAYVSFFGEENAPDHGRIGAFAKRIGSASMALELMFGCLSRPPNGPVLDYLEVTHKAKQGERDKPRYRAPKQEHKSGYTDVPQQPHKTGYTVPDNYAYANGRGDK